MEREGAAVTCDGRLFHRRAAATEARKTVDGADYTGWQSGPKKLHPFHCNEWTPVAE